MYKNCSRIPIYNFFELIDTWDKSFLLEKGENIEDFSDEELNNAIIDLLTEYNALTSNSKLIKEYLEIIDIEYLEAKYNITKEIISIYLDNKNIEILFILNEFNWAINSAKDIIPQIDKITKALVGIKNQLKIKKAGFINKYRKKTKDPTPNFNLQKQIISLEINIPLSYKIDIYTDSIERFVIWNETLEDKNTTIKKIKSKQNGAIKHRR